MHYATAVCCYLEAPLTGGGIQKLDCVHGHSGYVTRSYPGKNLKEGKVYYGLGNQAPDWAICSNSGQNISRSGQKEIIHAAIQLQCLSCSSHVVSQQPSRCERHLLAAAITLQLLSGSSAGG